MGIQAETPWALLLLLPWAAYVWWMAVRTPRLAGTRKAAAIAVRAIITLLLIALVAGLQPYTTIHQRNVVFVADRSASVKDESAIGQWIGEAWRNKPEDDYGAILSVGGNAIVDRSLTSEPLPMGDGYRFRTGLNDSYTDLAKGLQLAAAMLREQGGGRIVLLSDGEENTGDVQRGARLLKDAGIPVDVVHAASELRKDASFDELKVPVSLKQGETFSFELTIQSTFAGNAVLRLYQDDAEISGSEVQLERGSNRFVLESVALAPGFHRFRAEIFAEGDEQPLNNEAYAFSKVSGPPMVLIVEGEPGASANLEAALTASAVGHETIEPERLSMELTAYAAYDSIILNNVPATRIAAKPMEWLAKATSDYGVGLMMLGGDNSFGLGGYFQTPVERALPVYMDLQGKKQIPSLGLVLVIDRSGSMAGGPLELAKEAAMRTVELLRDVDTVGVIAFDSSPWWVVEPTKLTEREEVLDKISGIQPAGGTEIYSAVEAGYNGLLKIDAQRKHMILLTDGQSATNMNYDLITDAMVERMMTLSTVAVGDGADQALLQRLAERGKGRYYFTNDQSTLPAIFSRETVLMSRTYIVDGKFVPAAGEAGDWSRLWQGGVPSVQAYIATTPKEMAEVALWSPEGDPLLARWTYGSGRTIAWSSDATGLWAPDWMTWPSFPGVFAEWVKWTFPQFESAPYRLSAVMDGSSGKLIVEAEGDSGESGAASGGLGVMLQNQSGAGQITQLMPVTPGTYETELPLSEPGAYLAHVGTVETAADGTPSIGSGVTAGFVIPYAPEYRIGESNGKELLDNIAAMTGGRSLSAEESDQAFAGPPARWREPYDWSRPFLMAILLLWLVDIALRRLSLPWHRLGAVLQAPGRLFRRENSGESRAAAGAAAAVENLKRRTEQKRRFYNDDSSSPPAAKPAKQAASGPLGDAAARGAQASFAQQHPTGTGSESSPAAASQRRRDEERPTSIPAERQTASQEAKGHGNEAGSTINRLLAAKNKNKR